MNDLATESEFGDGPARSGDRFFILTLIIGILMGMTILSLVGYLLWATGNLQFGEVSCPSVEELCPQTFDLPTSTPSPTSTDTATPSPPEIVTATPDLPVTATAACATFEAEFPGTPCP